MHLNEQSTTDDNPALAERESLKANDLGDWNDQI